MKNDELLRLNEEGLIPGPQETEENFLSRVERAKVFYEAGEWISKWDWDGMDDRVQELFGFKPKFLPAFYSNRELRIWEGAACWIEGDLCQVQLREGLRKGRYLGYERGEILAHEAAHAARAAFDEEGCEEFFAYMTSEKKWRRVLGPIVKSGWEVWPLFGCMLLGFFGLGAGWISLGFFRLVRWHWRLRCNVKRALHLIGEEKKARAFVFRLTDDEVKKFAKGVDILEYAQRQNCLRWKLLKLAYLKGEQHGKENCS